MPSIHQTFQVLNDFGGVNPSSFFSRLLPYLVFALAILLPPCGCSCSWLSLRGILLVQGFFGAASLPAEHFLVTGEPCPLTSFKSSFQYQAVRPLLTILFKIVPLSPEHSVSILSLVFLFFVFHKFNFYFILGIVDLQYSVSFGCTEKWFSYTYAYIHPFTNSFPI